jgi:flavin reductase (DIM6/NTAB) family NADH-FMN oxidoreductase RutF
MELKQKEYTKLLIRPVVVISTISDKDIPNAAPFSFNSPISSDPPLYGFSCHPKHDTWKNIQKNREFVVNIVSRDFGELMHILEEKYPYEVNEIEKAGLEEEKAKRVKPPRIKSAIAWIECEMERYIELGDHIWIVGKVLEVEIRDDLWDGVILEEANPLCHIAGESFAADMKVKRYKRA